jgi:CzcA family heavy metal efflux pump
MIREIVTLSVKFRVLVVSAAVVLLGLGLVQLRAASVDGFPEFAPPLVQVQAEALGLSAAEVEQLITVPLEQDLLNGVPWLDQIRSESVPGLSTIDMIFEPGTDTLKARQMVQEHLTQAHALPQVGTPPVMIQPLSSTSRVMMISLQSKDVSLIDLSILARWKIKPRLMGLTGVANVAIWGQRDRQLQVQVDPEQLKAHGITLSQVVNSTGNALWVSPLTFVEASTPGTGGFIDTSTQRFAIQHVLPITTAKDLSAVSIEDTNGQTLTLGQVANVVEDHQPLIGDAVLGGDPGLMIVVEKFPEANVDEVTAAIENAMSEMQPGLSGITINTDVYRPATFLDTALSNLARWAIIALVLITTLLLGFLWSWRAALVALFAMVVSLVAAAYVLYLRGTSFNVMILAGLVVALGVVIDDSVTNVEEIRRRVREHRAADDTRTTASIVVRAAMTTRGPLLYATLVVLLIPLPALALGGVAGAFATPLVLSYVLAVVVSTLVALIVTPALSMVMIGGAPRQRRTGPLTRAVERGFDLTARGSIRPRLMFGWLAVLAIALLAVIPQLARSEPMLPALQDRDLLVHWQAAPGTSLQEMTRITSAAAGEVRAIAGVGQVGSHLGRALMADQSGNVNSGEMWVRLTDSADYQATVDDIKRVVHGYPGMRSEVLTYTDDRVRAAQTGSSDPLVVRVYGTDLTELTAKAEQVRSLIADVPGVVSPSVQKLVQEPTIEVQVKLAAAEQYGITPGDVRRATATYYAGLPVGSLYEDQKIFDVVVWGAPNARYTPATVSDLLIDTPAGGRVRLGDVATVQVAPAPTVIKHDNISRSVDVTAQVNGSISDVTTEVSSRVAALSMPTEYHAEVLGAAEAQVSLRWRIAGLAFAVAIGTFLLLQAAFSSWRLAAAVFLTLPLATAGGVLTAFFVGGIGTLGALAGLVAVIGIAARTNILLVRRFQEAEPGDGGVAGPDAVLRATRERVAPIVITALAVALVFLPLLFLGSTAGTEVVYPLAVVVLGGIVTSTLLALFVLPGLYVWLNRRPSSAEPGPTVQEPEPQTAPVLVSS